MRYMDLVAYTTLAEALPWWKSRCDELLREPRKCYSHVYPYVSDISSIIAYLLVGGLVDSDHCQSTGCEALEAGSHFSHAAYPSSSTYTCRLNAHFSAYLLLVPTVWHGLDRRPPIFPTRIVDSICLFYDSTLTCGSAFQPRHVGEERWQMGYRLCVEERQYGFGIYPGSYGTLHLGIDNAYGEQTKLRVSVFAHFPSTFHYYSHCHSRLLHQSLSGAQQW